MGCHIVSSILLILLEIIKVIHESANIGIPLNAPCKHTACVAKHLTACRSTVE